MPWHDDPLKFTRKENCSSNFTIATKTSHNTVSCFIKLEQTLQTLVRRGTDRVGRHCTATIKPSLASLRPALLFKKVFFGSVVNMDKKKLQTAKTDKELGSRVILTALFTSTVWLAFSCCENNIDYFKLTSIISNCYAMY